MGSSNETSWYGPVKNPWDLKKVPGGSSGGSAAAVAARIAPAATGTDTGGSIRQPAALTSLTGFKPTYGRVSRYGMIAFGSSLDQGGIITASAADAALLLGAMAGFDPLDSTSVETPVPDYAATLDQPLSGLRIGLVKEFFEEGLDAGVIEKQEHQMVRNVFRLDDRQVGSMMIPRAEIVWLEATATPAEVLRTIAEAEHSRYPVCRGGLDDILGIVSAQSLLQQSIQGKPIELTAQLQPPVFVPETLSGMELLEQFRVSAAQLVFVVDEYGEVQGMITVRDVLEAITGEFTTATESDSWAVRRHDGSWLFDGLIPTPELKDRLGLKELPEEDRGRYNTLAGMIMLLLGRLPEEADSVEWEGWRFEVVDLDGKRVDKVLVRSIAPGVDEPQAA
jgi:Mg2+/Co2+ transporter CorC